VTELLDLTRTRKTGSDGFEDRWILSGPDGAVEYHEIRGGMPLGIEVHRRNPQHASDEPSHGCDVLDGADCYPDGGSGAGRELQRKYASAKFDEEVIWAELGDWYADEFTSTKTAARESLD
jgi:hypothetical protein